MPMTRSESRMSAKRRTGLAQTHISHKAEADYPDQQAERPAQGLDNRIVPVGFRFFELGVQAAEHPALDNIDQPGRADKASNPQPGIQPPRR